MMSSIRSHYSLTVACVTLLSCSNGGDGDASDAAAADSDTNEAEVGPTLKCAEEVVAGWAFSCVRASDGRVWCWGHNDKGQLTGSLSDAVPTPRLVVGLRAPAVKLAAGVSHACAALSDDTVWCWGANDQGQLGNGTITDHEAAPVQVQGLEGGVLSLTAYGGRYKPSAPDNPDYPITDMSHSCAVRADGSVWCWGSDLTGQIGGGVKGSPPVPTPVRVKTIGASFAQVAAGGMFTCALAANGKAECWGRDNWGQLGVGNLDSEVRPPGPVNGLEDVSRIATGDEHACAIVADGAMWCWGENVSGQCGLEPANPSRVPSPVPIPLSGKARGLVAGLQHSCALLEDGNVWCWGSNFSGALGAKDVPSTNPYGTTNVPTRVTVVQGVTSLASTTVHVCAIDSADHVWCWGDNVYGALGIGVVEDSLVHDPIPTPVRVLSYCP